MSTIKEIAELAGVSRGTVDRVLNHRGNVNPITERKIMEIAQALHYKPNRAGIILAARKKNLKLGVVLFGPGNPFFDEVMRGVRDKETELENYNCSILIKQVPLDAGQQLAAIGELEAAGVNGIALAPCNEDIIRNKINDLAIHGIPVITLNTDIEKSDRLAYVGSNYYHTGETAAGLMSLITEGPVHVGIITGSPHILCHTQRIAGFAGRLSKAYPRIRVAEVIANHDDEFISYEQTTALLNKHPEINALFFAAAGVYGGCRAVIASGRQRAIRIISNDCVETTRQMIEEGVISATICQQPAYQGAKPLDMLFNYLTGGELPDRELNYVGVDIRIRETV